MNELALLSAQEIRDLQKAPAYISLLAALKDDTLDSDEKRVAIHFTHTKTYSSAPMLKSYYQLVEESIKADIESLNKSLPANIQQREHDIRNALSALDTILKKLPSNYTSALRQSWVGYTEHISRAHRSVVELFIFPMYLKGLTDF